MTLEEAIKHCEEKACGNNECANEHRQLAEWLKELQLLKSLRQGQPDVDLEKEIKNYLATKCAGDDEPSVSEIALHFYELGLNARKEE